MIDNSSILEENKKIKNLYRLILKTSIEKLSKEDKKLIRKSFDFANEAHRNQVRQSGELFIMHPLNVAKIVAQEIGLGATSIIVAILHDVIEDTKFTKKYIEKTFNEKIANLVYNLTKIKNFQDKTLSPQTENFKKLLLGLSNDARVILIKIADRLHNMRTLEHLNRDKQIKIASETLYVYAPIANRLGLFKIKSELEDISLKYTEPSYYEKIVNKMEKSREEQEKFIKSFIRKIKTILNKKIETNIKVNGRYKSIYSIFKKIQDKKTTFEEIYDRFAIRIIFDIDDPEEEKFISWKIYSLITEIFKPNPTRLRDWISKPKFNGYEALHTTVMGPKGKWIEIQIRSKRMNEIAEMGYAAHYRYKNPESKEDFFEDWLNRVKEALKNVDYNSSDFVDNLKSNLSIKEIYVFTPLGEIKSLPKGSTIIDFAFCIHSKIGEKCFGGKVNGMITSLDYELKNGDQVEIITSKSQYPKEDWLKFVKTSKAKSSIKALLNKQKVKIVKYGREVIERKLKRLKVEISEKKIHELASFLNIKTVNDLFYKTGIGLIENSSLKRFSNIRDYSILNIFRKKRVANKPIKNQNISKDSNNILFEGKHKHLEYKIASCCNPIYGDDIFGFTTINDSIKVHKKDCPNSIHLYSNYNYRILKAQWEDLGNYKNSQFNVNIIVKGIDNRGLINELTRIISKKMHIDMRNIEFKTHSGLMNGKIEIQVRDESQVNKIIENIRKVNGVKQVYRE